MNIRFRVELSEAERDALMAMLGGGRQAARKLKRAQILLAADAGSSDEVIAACVGVGPSTVYRTKRRFVEGNLPAALQEAPRPGAMRKLKRARRKRCWWRPPAPARPKVGPAGRWSFWRMRWSGWCRTISRYPHCWRAVRDLSAGGNSPPPATAGVSLHAEARQLAQHGRD
jgi:hypothetical protein